MSIEALLYLLERHPELGRRIAPEHPEFLAQLRYAELVPFRHDVNSLTREMLESMYEYQSINAGFKLPKPMTAVVDKTSSVFLCEFGDRLGLAAARGILECYAITLEQARKRQATAEELEIFESIPGDLYLVNWAILYEGKLSQMPNGHIWLDIGISQPGSLFVSQSRGLVADGELPIMVTADDLYRGLFKTAVGALGELCYLRAVGELPDLPARAAVS